MLQAPQTYLIDIVFVELTILPLYVALTKHLWLIFMLLLSVTEIVYPSVTVLKAVVNGGGLGALQVPPQVVGPELHVEQLVQDKTKVGVKLQ